MTATRAPGRKPATTYVYLYAVADRDFRLPVDGTVDGDLQTTGVGRVTVVHTTVERAQFENLDTEDLSESGRLAALAEHHDDTLQALSAAGTVLPVRLGTLFPDAEAMTGLIAAAEAKLAAQLDRIRGRHEWVVRVRADRVEATPDLATTNGTQYLQRRRAERDHRDARRDTVVGALTSIDQTLRTLAEAVAGPGISAGSSPTMARAYLIADDTYPDFAAAVATAAAELYKVDCPLAVSGPLPAYSFVGVRWEVPGS